MTQHLNIPSKLRRQHILQRSPLDVDVNSWIKAIQAVTKLTDALRNAKRFHATVHFIADTGLKEPTDLLRPP